MVGRAQTRCRAHHSEPRARAAVLRTARRCPPALTQLGGAIAGVLCSYSQFSQHLNRVPVPRRDAAGNWMYMQARAACGGAAPAVPPPPPASRHVASPPPPPPAGAASLPDVTPLTPVPPPRPCSCATAGPLSFQTGSKCGGRTTRPTTSRVPCPGCWAAPPGRGLNTTHTIPAPTLAPQQPHRRAQLTRKLRVRGLGRRRGAGLRGAGGRGGGGGGGRRRLGKRLGKWGGARQCRRCGAPPAGADDARWREGALACSPAPAPYPRAPPHASACPFRRPAATPPGADVDEGLIKEWHGAGWSEAEARLAASPAFQAELAADRKAKLICFAETPAFYRCMGGEKLAVGRWWWSGGHGTLRLAQATCSLGLFSRPEKSRALLSSHSVAHAHPCTPRCRSPLWMHCWWPHFMAGTTLVHWCACPPGTHPAPLAPRKWPLGHASLLRPAPPPPPPPLPPQSHTRSRRRHHLDHPPTRPHCLTPAAPAGCRS